MNTFPPNSKKAANADKKVEQVTSAVVTRRKKPLGKQFKSVFFGGDAKTALHYVIFSVLLPAAKDMLVDAGAQGMEKLVFGDASRSRRGRPAQTGQLGHIAYNAMSRGSQPSRQMSQRARETHDFDEILLGSRVEATDVLDAMYDIISKYEIVSVSDLYSLTGLEGTHVDNKWGWTDLRGASVRRVRNDGYLLDLPTPEFLE